LGLTTLRRPVHGTTNLHVVDKRKQKKLTVTPQHGTDPETELDNPRSDSGTTNDSKTTNYYIYTKANINNDYLLQLVDSL